MKYLKLKFKNGGFFEENSNQNVSISVNQISNVLHVLLGERPRPSYRETKVNIPIIPEIFEMANQSYIKIDTPLTLQIGKTKYNKKMFYPREIIHTNKNVKNSYRDKNGSYFTWEILKVFLGVEIYNKTISIFEDVLGYSPTTKKAMDTVEDIRKIMSKDDNVKSFLSYLESMERFSFKNAIDHILSNCNNSLLLLCKELIDNNKTPFAKLLMGYEKSTEINKISDLRILATNVRGIEPNFRKVYGELLIPLTDYGVKKLNNGMGISRILDGGMVWIDNLLNPEDINMYELESYIKINDLEEYENNFKVQ